MKDATLKPSVVYPDSDGMPMADNTVQLEMITKIKEGIDLAVRGRDDVFVGGDLLWYYAEGDPKSRIAPDVMIAFGRPPGARSSYLQWEEGGVAPQFVIEVLSPSNSPTEMARKRAIYESLGVLEYLEIEPEREELRAWSRVGGRLVEQRVRGEWVSSRVGLRIDTRAGLAFRMPDGAVFQKPSEWIARERQRADAERQRADAERQRADELARQLDELRQRSRA